jgi:hypothetical protein
MATLAFVAMLTFAQVDEVEAVAVQAGVDVTDLQGAVNTTGLQPVQYLRMTGELPTPVPAYTVWDRLAQCESGGNWHVDAYHDGGLQFLPSTWDAYGGRQYARYAWQASREQQIAIAAKVQAAAGWKQWPVCSIRLGLR